ncbi:hypothetical protein PAUR_a4523 [Pseudoalteromonas aurantia 208]|uniref:Transposase n=1 Tax=Pseudoalteromonas aurantia 208 TaxID=1314867 RepID=A0ABR9EG01_9GAMM|nr:hypothetical protein [Pseudoalteromonas aurantia 208]
MKATPRVRKIALLGKFAYPELRLFTPKNRQCCRGYTRHITGKVSDVFAGGMTLVFKGAAITRPAICQHISF